MGLGPGPPSGHRSAAPSSTSGVNSPCAPRASHCQYSTIAYWAQQVAGVGRDPAAQKVVVAGHRTGRIRLKDVSLKRVARNRADAIDYVAGPFSLSIYCSPRCRRIGMSALEELRRSTERQLWAQSGQARFGRKRNGRRRKRTFDGQSQSAKFDPSRHFAAMRNLVATGA